MRIIFMGTPDFAVPTLETLIQSGHTVKAVVTQPDKPKGRSGKLQFTPVKEMALKYGIPVLQPAKVKDQNFLQELIPYRPDVIIVVAFGQILPEDILNMPPFGCVNVHASLLPKLRGAAPIQWAVINGEQESGVTTMIMDKGLDTGNMMLKSKITLSKDETGGSLHDKLSMLGGPLILDTLKRMEDNTIIEIKQEEKNSTYAKMLNKKMGKINFNQKADEIERLIRGLNPWPSAYTVINGQTLKIWKAEILKGPKQGKEGEIVLVTNQDIHIQTGEDILVLKEVQLEGKKRLPVETFLRGYSLESGINLQQEG